MRKALLASAILSIQLLAPQVGAEEVSEAELEADAWVIGKITLETNNVFDLTDERENNFLFRLVNKLHIVTKEDTIRKQLLIQPGDTYSVRLVAETERILRARAYLYDVEISTANAQQGNVDLNVMTRDVWTLKPGLTASRTGGENKFGIELEELNLLGYGQEIRVARVDDVDRTTKSFQFSDPHIGHSWVSGTLSLSDNSDGRSTSASLVRPFYALDTRWSLGGALFDDDRRTAFYTLGEEAAEYQHRRQLYSIFGGWSKGLQNNRVRRYQAGYVFDDNRFSPVADGSLPAIVPQDRKLSYPFIGVDFIEDEFTTTRNKEQIGRTEDFYMGQRISARLGYASESFGADRNALVYSGNFSRGFGAIETKALLTSLWASGRIENGSTKNAMLGLNARFYLHQSEKRMFFWTIDGVSGKSLDQDNIVELGGDTGLRGYPLRYQSGDSKLLFTVEQRIFWDWYPFRLFRVGAAVFADAGRTWGDNATNATELGWLRDVGFGLRFAPTRTGFSKILHLDIAFPLDGDASIDDVQILLESKRSF